MTNQLRSPVLFDTNILFVYISLVTAQIKEVSPEKKHIFFWAFHKLSPPLARILANFSFLRTCQIQFGQGSPLHTDWATFSLWKMCENHFGQEKKLTCYKGFQSLKAPRWQLYSHGGAEIVT